METGITLKHEDLRSAFDRSFEAAPVERDHELVHLLVVRIGAARFALKVNDLAGLARAEKVVPIPSKDPTLLGLAGLKGRIVAVYSLAALIGNAELVKVAERWLVMCRSEDRLALSFTAAEGTVMVPTSELCPVAPGAPAFAVAALGTGAVQMWLLNVGAMVAAIVARTAAPASDAVERAG
ncbi:MAG TPA: chemotaxis protein CheW [Candidatus Binataceae bacterium]|jgi:chemotaxis signal transduction protein|nr:chemotaxis protein CheW [Candidatus Binataceae bacterium]